MSSVVGIDCPSDCAQSYLEGTVVELRAIPESDAEFVEWSLPACGADPRCLLELNEGLQIEAVFTAPDDPVFSDRFEIP